MRNNADNESPEGAVFDLTRFLDGRSTAWGVFEDRTGQVRRRFTVDVSGRWVGEVFEVNEHFVFDDGEVDTRVWRFEVLDAGRFTATASDVIGLAEGRFDKGFARMRYVFRMQIKGRSVNVDIDDRFYPLDANRVINRATVSKLGVRLGELTIYFDRDVARGEGLRASANRVAA